MKVVSNTGPLIGLAKINQLPILKSIYKEVMIPPMVHKELWGKVGMESDQIDSALQDFIKVTEIKTLKPATESALVDLDEGERQAISLASTIDDEVLLLLDDRAGREAAKKLGIPTTGLIGIMLLAKERGLINNVRPLLEEIRNHGYWLSDEVIEVARKLAGE